MAILVNPLKLAKRKWLAKIDLEKNYGTHKNDL